MNERSPPPIRSDFAEFRRVFVRWSDVDTYGHVNNAIHYQWFDTVVNGCLVEQQILDPRSSAAVFLVVETGCIYHAEILFGQSVELGLKIEHIGMSSVVYRIGVFTDGAEAACAVGSFVHVLVNKNSGKPQAVPTTAKQKFALLLV